ncbi:2,3,4,5-tetrahydropyridine-2,6-dicarboxylate N-succinyltransferase [Amnibacterium setariae]|uniref:2,3,4,5-tetrahydropyridine-2,6-dicarboxylate N-succinyltransferase n=1 Tax=Amnibacterium setariae TaxID=2306585 RepID=A0A3A1U7B7_9MICO|nr:2,3,4,5-tetrahydropyridine-2,6-dicarboxylate N-succinyltransferase [Amnibacterium setariae]RIX30938.1 2,3,4,5-tetrahydropyridine-2,6-dicarboxylate N-succinyltransferase [Amnibacterium setariae]
MSDPARTAWGHGLATRTKDGTVLDVWFPAVALGAAPESDPPAALEDQEHIDDLRRVRLEAVTVESDLDGPVASTADAYLRLHLLSHLVVEPNTISLEGLMAHLPINAWTARGPMLPADASRRLPQLRRAGLAVLGLDRFPRLTDYVLPDRVRIADGARVRLGAHLAPGTVVMHAGFVNFNAGTLGTSMVEGRISQGVVVGDGSDIGGGASIMGTLSGGGTQRVSIGRRSLLGANAGLGIAVGDDCVVEAGLYLTAGTKLTLRVPDQEPRVVKAVELSGEDAWLFRRNSLTGEVEAVPRTGPGIALNPTLHA